MQLQKMGGEVDKTYMEVEDMEVYQKLCKLHIEVCDLSHEWPQEERYELGSQVRRSSNSSPAQLAEKHDDRHIRNNDLDDRDQDCGKRKGI